MVNPIFIVGNGRSGTNWLGRIIRSHPDITTTIEQWPMIDLSLDIVMVGRTKRFPELLAAYRQQLAQNNKPRYCDKSHTNLWLAERLLHYFPRAYFLAIERDVIQCVSSMKRHHGINSWSSNWRSYPIPNKFLGIDKDTQYDLLSDVEKHTLRWISHHKRTRYLLKIMPNHVYYIQYSDLVNNNEGVLQYLSEALNIDNKFESKINKKPLTKWQDGLSASDIEQIQNLIRLKLPDYNFCLNQ